MRLMCFQVHVRWQATGLLRAVAEVLPTDKSSFEIIVVDRRQNRSPEYLAVNPLGTVPALVTDDGWLTLESFSVLLHIARFPEARLAPPLASRLRDRVHTLLSVMATVGQLAFQMRWRLSGSQTRMRAALSAIRVRMAASRSSIWRLMVASMASKDAARSLPGALEWFCSATPRAIKSLLGRSVSAAV